MVRVTVDGAICHCNAGSNPTALLATVTTACIGGRVGASINDTQFSAPFGTCAKLEAKRGIKPAMCEYAPAASWMQPLGSIQFGASPILGDGAKLNCIHGGEITILESGQGLTCIWNPAEEDEEGENASGVSVAALGGIAVLDGPEPGPADVVAGIIGLAVLAGLAAHAGSEESGGSWVLTEEPKASEYYEDKYGNLGDDYEPTTRDPLTGGKKNQRDNDYGINNDDFWAWWERHGKQGADLKSKREADDAYEQWVAEGRPKR